MPDQEDRNWFDATRSGRGSDEMVAELQREVFGPTYQAEPKLVPGSLYGPL